MKYIWKKGIFFAWIMFLMLFGLNSNADEALKGQIIDGSLLTSDDYASDIKVLQPEDLDVERLSHLVFIYRMENLILVNKVQAWFIFLEEHIVIKQAMLFMWNFL
ncbi:MAG: hypothetical protein ACLR2E_15035 [Lachnospiraceae bacterium]